MPQSTPPEFGINSWLEDELYQQYLHDRKTVDDSWKQVFESNGGTPAPANGTPVVTTPGVTAPVTVTSAPAPAEKPSSGDQLLPLRGAAARIAENMNASLSIPLATSQRVIPVKVIDENRRIINEHRTLIGKTEDLLHAHRRLGHRQSASNQSHAQLMPMPKSTASRSAWCASQVNIGIAVDVAGKDGARSLKVPNIKNAGALNFAQYVAAFDDIVARARANKLTVQDFEGTTISLTNPGTVGTLGSIPRLMPGQGAIIATGTIDYPAEYHGATEQLRALLGLSKVMTVTCTYDHRVIQGAESGMFLGRLASAARRRGGLLRGAFRRSQDSSQAGPLGAGPAGCDSGPARRANWTKWPRKPPSCSSSTPTACAAT